ncbi:FimD/PapC C-terminal domain-containing protein, partial [Salmonella enterica subsp. enterica serovar Schwarzengrund]
LKMPAFEWVHVQLHQQKGMISLSPPTICNSAEQVLGHIRLADSTSPPFGSMVVSGKTGRTAGMVGDDGLVYLTGLSGEDRRTLDVSWNGRTHCRLTLPESADLSRGPLLLPCR